MSDCEESFLIKFHIIIPEQYARQGINQTGFSTLTIIVGRGDSTCKRQLATLTRGIVQCKFALPYPVFTRSGIVEKRSKTKRRSGGKIDTHLQSGSQPRSEEHTSELQSRQYLVCRLLLEKKKYYTLYTATLLLKQS